LPDDLTHRIVLAEKGQMTDDDDFFDDEDDD
jgi:hypothetical protein